MSVMKLKDFSATKHFSMHFKRIFGANTTFGDIAKVKAQHHKKIEDYLNSPMPMELHEIFDSENGTLTPKGKKDYLEHLEYMDKQNSTGNLMGSHVEKHLKNQQEYKVQQLKEKL